MCIIIHYFKKVGSQSEEVALSRLDAIQKHHRGRSPLARGEEWVWVRGIKFIPHTRKN
jgi:hypothetical protein